MATQAVNTDPKNREARLVLARGLMARGDLDQAEKLLKELMAAAPKSAMLHSQMGQLQLFRRNRAAAAAEFDAALAINPLQIDAVGGQVALDLQQKDQAGAVRRVDALVQRAPQNAAALTLAARTHAITGDIRGAEPLLEKAIAADPTSIQAYSLLGQVYMKEGRLDDARQQFENLAKRQSRPVSALTMVGMIQQMQGRTPDAQKTFERVLQIDSHAAVAANNLAWIYTENNGNLDVALQLAQTAKAALPEQAEVDDTLGWIYYRKDLLALAVSSLQQSVDRDPKNPISQYHLGLAYFKTGDKVKAKKALEAALQLKPDFNGASEATRLISQL
jgi:tetratricopeptide (TPR) repeat protein